MTSRRSGPTFIIGGLLLLALLVAGGYFLLWAPAARSHSFSPEAVSPEPPTPDAATRAATSFLHRWSGGRLADAAAGTDAPSTARADLQGYADGLHVTTLAFARVAAGGSAQQRGGTHVTYTTTAHVAGGTWSYPGGLDVVQDTDGNTAVHWAPSVLHPTLTDGQSLTAGALDRVEIPAASLASDRRTRLSTFRSLLDIAATVGQHGAARGGRSGRGVAVIDGKGAQVKTLAVFTRQQPPAVATTIDARLQSVAEKAVTSPQLAGRPAGVVALDWRTGHILAIAYAGDSGDIAINAVKAPGSTMKIITAAALFDKAGLSPQSPAPCTDSIMANGQTFHNDSGVRPDPHATIASAFTVSCNTSFIKDGFDALVHDGDASALHAEATEVFGLGSWSIGGGVGTRDPSVPADPEGGDQAAQLIGQGRVTATPLVMASVAATVRAGGFHQPVIVAGQPQQPAARPISPRTAAWLQQMMRSVVTSGTAAPRLGGLAGVGAKTGTAEEGDHTNGWLTAYDDRIAVAALVEGGSSGVDSAGYVVRDLLTAD